jgi:hypothetical protein
MGARETTGSVLSDISTGSGDLGEARHRLCAEPCSLARLVAVSFVCLFYRKLCPPAWAAQFRTCPSSSAAHLDELSHPLQ